MTAAPRGGRFALHGACLAPLCRRRAVLLEHLTREIERAGDQDARRRIEIEAPDRGERLAHVVDALRRDADPARDIGDRLGGQAFFLVRDRHRHDPAGKAREVLQETSAILARKHADDEHQRAGDPLLEVGERIGDGAPAVRIVAPVEPKLASGRDQRGERPLRDTLHARRPIGLGDAGLEGRGRDLERLGTAQGGNRHACILELVPAIKLRGGQIDEADVVLIDEAATLLRRHPVLARDPDRRLDARGLALDHGKRFARLRGDDTRDLGL